MAWIALKSIVVCIACFFCIDGAYADVFDLELKNFDEEAYAKWATFSLIDKLPYILDQSMRETLSSEYKRLLADVFAYSGSTSINAPSLLSRFGDFHQLNDIDLYIKACDTNKDGEIDQIEYVICRGWYDAYLNPHGLGEYDVLESIIVHDYEEKRNDPTFQIPGYVYDDNGIIID